MNSSPLRSEVSGRSPHRPRWVNVGEAPFSRAYTYRLIRRGVIISVLLIEPGARRGRRLLDSDSIDRFLETLAKQQQAAKPKAVASQARRIGS